MRELGDAETRRILDRLKAERPGMPMPKQPLAAYQDFWRHVLVDDVEGVKVITLRRPEAMNALHDELTDEVLAVIRKFEADPAVKGFVLTGYGARAFCAGADIGRFPSMLGDAAAATQYARDCSRLLVHLDAMKKPVVAALNGMALGGGLELAMRCHGIVALKEAWMQLPEITLGIVPGIGAMVVPYRRWPQAAATFHGMLRRAEKLKAVEAHKLGVVDALADDLPGLIAAAVARVRALAGRPSPIAAGAIALAPLESIAPAAASRPAALQGNHGHPGRRRARCPAMQKPLAKPWKSATVPSALQPAPRPPAKASRPSRRDASRISARPLDGRRRSMV
jgi:enoyl-CoA hydratase/3-hydroxyacyl-CoA dehydrogenase